MRNIIMKALDLNTFIKVRVYSPSPIPWCLIAGVQSTQKAPNNDGLNEWTGGPPWTPGNANIPYIWLWNVFWEVTPEFESMLRKAATLLLAPGSVQLGNLHLFSDCFSILLNASKGSILLD